MAHATYTPEIIPIAATFSLVAFPDPPEKKQKLSWKFESQPVTKVCIEDKLAGILCLFSKRADSKIFIALCNAFPDYNPNYVIESTIQACGEAHPFQHGPLIYRLSY